MPHRSRLAGTLCAVFVVTLVATVNASAAKVNCATQVNNTPSTLLPCITTKNLYNHMQAIEKIAIDNPGPDGHPSRNSGEPGYRASVDYVANLMTQAGYDVTIQPYRFLYYAYTSVPTLTQVAPTASSFALNVDWTAGQSTGRATNAVVQPAGGIVLPPTADPSSTSGCTSADFTGFVPGNMALIQRGGCNFGVKVQNAQAAGASGVIIFNEGNPDRTGLMGISIEDVNGTVFVPTIPVAFTTFAIGQTLYNQYTSGTPARMSFDIQALVDLNRLDWNVIAESKGGDKNHVVVVDAHLDAIYGEGMLDNASGSVTILDIAQQMKNVNPTNKLRFVWFGGEEVGLLGSQYYVDTLSSNDLSHIGYDLDADVTATPNYTIGVLDPAAGNLFGGDQVTFPNRVYKASLIARDAGVDYFTSLGLNHEFFSPEGTDAISFNNVGIPASGVLTGQDCCKTQAEVDLFGGHTGNFEGISPTGCVDNAFLWCDNLVNNDFDVMTWVSRGFANMVLTMAFDTKVMSSSTSVVYKKRLPIAETVSRHIVNR